MNGDRCTCGMLRRVLHTFVVDGLVEVDHADDGHLRYRVTDKGRSDRETTQLVEMLARSRSITVLEVDITVARSQISGGKYQVH